MQTFRRDRRFVRLGRTAALLALACVAALGGAPSSAQDPADQISDKLPLWEPGHAITTNIKDALPIVTTLKGLQDDEPRPIPDDWTFEPGYYRGVIRSYCLHAGTYGPTQGDGYLIAPIKGDRAALIRNFLLRSQQNPKIDQQDVQRLIWGTEDGVTWDSYENDFKVRVMPLLTPQEIVLLNLEPKRAEVAGAIKDKIGGLIPGKVRQVVDTYAQMRDKITGTASYEELEKVAVKTGVAPWGKDSRKDVEPGSWAYVGDGFFIRAFPESYMTTTLEIYKVAPAIVKRDDRNRIVHFDSGGHTIDVVYDDTPAKVVEDGKDVSVWKFKTVTFHDPDGHNAVIENKGYIVAEADRATLCGPFVPGGDDSGGLDDFGHFKDGMKAATNPGNLKDQGKWIADDVTRVGSAWNAGINALAGRDTKDASPKKLDPTRHTASPANTGKQRLALSAFTKK